VFNFWQFFSVRTLAIRIRERQINVDPKHCHRCHWKVQYTIMRRYASAFCIRQAFFNQY